MSWAEDKVQLPDPEKPESPVVLGVFGGLSKGPGQLWSLRVGTVRCNVWI